MASKLDMSTLDFDQVKANNNYSASEEDLKMRVKNLLEKKNFVPILATILVGSDPASATYVKMKGNACERIGMKSIKVELDSSNEDEDDIDIDEFDINKI